MSLYRSWSRSIDWDSLGRHLDALAAHDIAAVVVNADTGEGAHLSPEERSSVIRFAVDRVGARVPVLAGLAAQYTAEAERLASDAHRAGARGLQVFAPAAFQGSHLDPDLPYEFHRAIAKAAGLPLIVYQMTAVRSRLHARVILRSRTSAGRRDRVVPGPRALRAHPGRRSRDGTFQLLSGADTFWSVASHRRRWTDAGDHRDTTNVRSALRAGRRLEDGGSRLAGIAADHRDALRVTVPRFSHCSKLCAFKGDPTAAVRPPLAPLSSAAAAQVRAAAEAAGLDRIDGGGAR